MKNNFLEALKHPDDKRKKVQNISVKNSKWNFVYKFYYVQNAITPLSVSIEVSSDLSTRML